MRTTIAIDDALLERAKRRAAEQRITLGSYIEEALRQRLAAAPATASSVELPTFTGGTGLAPGIDPTSNRSLYEALDEQGRLTA